MSEVAPRRTATCEESQVRRGRPSGTPVVPAAGTDPGGENVRLSHDAHKVPAHTTPTGCRWDGEGGHVASENCQAPWLCRVILFADEEFSSVQQLGRQNLQ